MSERAFGSPPGEFYRASDDDGELQYAPRVAREVLANNKTYSEREPELRKLQERAELDALLERHQVHAELIEVGEANYVLKIARTPARVTRRDYETGQKYLEDRQYQQVWIGPKSTAPVVTIDADDSLFGYTEVKGPRQDAFATFVLEELGYSLPPDVLKKLMSLTDAFSRWPDWGSSSNMYHFKAHKWALSWATSQFSGVSSEDFSAKLQEVEFALADIKDGLGNERQQSEDDTPFCFFPDRGRELFLNNFVPSEGIHRVFEPMLEPEPYYDAIEHMQTLAEAGAQTCVFTYGEPVVQLEKLLRLRAKLLESNKGWPYEYVFLTKEPKGVFMEELVVAAEHNSGLREDLLSDDPHAFMLVDDDPKQLRNFMQSQAFVNSNSGARLCQMQSLRPSTKTWEHRHNIFRHVPDMGRLVDESQGGTMIAGTVEDIATRELAEWRPDMTQEEYLQLRRDTAMQEAHRRAFANLGLQVKKLLAYTLSDLAQAEADESLRGALKTQGDYFYSEVRRAESLIEDSYGLEPMTL